MSPAKPLPICKEELKLLARLHVELFTLHDLIGKLENEAASLKAELDAKKDEMAWRIIEGAEVA